MAKGNGKVDFTGKFLKGKILKGKVFLNIFSKGKVFLKIFPKGKHGKYVFYFIKW